MTLSGSFLDPYAWGFLTCIQDDLGPSNGLCDPMHGREFVLEHDNLSFLHAGDFFAFWYVEWICIGDLCFEMAVHTHGEVTFASCMRHKIVTVLLYPLSCTLRIITVRL